MPRITVFGLGPGPLLEVSSVENTLRNMRIRHLEHFRTISVQSFTQPGFLASEVFTPAAPKLKELENSLPPATRSS